MKRERFVNIGLTRLLRRNISKGQLFGYAIANLVGLTIILSGILFYCDSHHHLKSSDKFFSDDYIVVSKKVKGINLSPVAFTEEEIEDIASQPWVKKIGRFTSGDYSVSASVNMGGRGMSTYLFFESVPDDFFDELPSEWSFLPGQKFVPIVLNKDYLALYNFGFALPQGLPQLSEEMIGNVPLRLVIRGENDVTEIFDAAVVGFSSRLNTIAVPQEFMDWANSHFSSGENRDASRLILKIDRLNPGDSEQYLTSHGLEIGGDKKSDSKVSEFMGLVSGVVTATGLVISLLALFIMLLSISLLLQKSRVVIRNIMLLGYSPSTLSLFYQKRVLILNSLITAVAVGLTCICRLIWHKTLLSLGLGNGNVLFMIGMALVYLLGISLINSLVIRNHILKIWKA
ncbi:MAG: hypothetical protein J1F38_09955 [Muribaculaceae bacterium]|nr:hypothetical protein [Muribaculaceae bacterium]